MASQSEEVSQPEFRALGGLFLAEFGIRVALCECQSDA